MIPGSWHRAVYRRDPWHAAVVATAIEEGAEGAELQELCDVLVRAAKAADGWR
jgi:hypothetical protein